MKTTNKSIFVLILILLLMLTLAQIGAAAEENITFTINQTEYYFVVGEEAIIPLEMENSHDKDITGTLAYTITQEINQQGFHYSNSNTNSQSFTVAKGNNIGNMGFGTSQDPALLKVSMTFNYNEKDDMVVNLDEIIIHFVQNKSQKQNQQNQKQSSSQKTSEQQSNQQQQNQQQQQQQPQHQQQQQQQSQTQQKANSMQQNTQQDMDSLKKQMQQDLEQKEQMKQELSKNIENNEQFKDMQEQLNKQGYKPESKNLNPIGNNSGKFQYNYKKENGDAASISGSMNKGKIDNLQKETAEDMNQMQQALENSPKFQQMKQELENKGYQMQKPEISKTSSTQATANAPFQNPATNQTANITADFINTTKEPTNIKLHEEGKLSKWEMALYTLLLLLIAIIGFLAYKKYFKKVPAHIQQMHETKLSIKTDYKKEAANMLDQAKELFKSGKRKEAYTRVSKALRYFYKHKLGAEKELTRDMVIRFLKKKKKSFQKAAECLDLCDMVKFAKYEANEKDFNKILKLAEGMIKRK